jgi:hypothetical protein
MKLYTEEQVLNSMLSMKTYIEKYDESVIDTIVEKHLKSLGGIEIPSDEEIEKESFDLYANHNTYSLNVRQYKAFKRGAKFVIDKIQGGEK